MSDFKDRAKKELVDAGEEAGRGLLKDLASWIKSRPLKRLIAKRRAEKKAGK